MNENSAYENGRIKDWYGFTVRRYNSLLKFFNDPAIPGDFIELKIKYVLEGARRSEESLEGLAGFYANMEKWCGKMIYYRKGLTDRQAQKIILLILLALASPKLAASQPLLQNILNADVMTSLQKIRGFGA